MIKLEKILQAAGVSDTVTTYLEYVEPGYYSDLPILMGDWNKQDRLAKILSKLGYDLVFEDEWTSCHHCNRLVRAQPDNWGWKPSFYVNEEAAELLCKDCVKADPTDYLHHLTNNPDACDTLGIDLEEHGFKAHEQFTSRMFERNTTPKEVSAKLKEMGTTHLFKLDWNEQFGSGWSVWVK